MRRRQMRPPLRRARRARVPDWLVGSPRPSWPNCRTRSWTEGSPRPGLAWLLFRSRIGADLAYARYNVPDGERYALSATLQALGERAFFLGIERHATARSGHPVSRGAPLENRDGRVMPGHDDDSREDEPPPLLSQAPSRERVERRHKRALIARQLLPLRLGHGAN